MKTAAGKRLIYGGVVLCVLAFALPANPESPAPDFSLHLLDGGAFKLSEQKGKVVVIDFWATWCGPCMRSLPGMSELEKQFKNKNVVFLGVSKDWPGQEDKVKQTLDKFDIGYACGIDVDNIASDYGVHGIPCVIVIGRNGMIQARLVGYSKSQHEKLKAAVESALGGQSNAVGAEPSMEDRPRKIQPAVLNEKFFLKKWESKEGIKPGPSFSNEKMAFRFPSSSYLVRSANEMVAFDASSGARIGSVSLADGDFENQELQRISEFFYLRNPAGNVLVSVTKKVGIRDPKSGKMDLRQKKTVLAGYNQEGKIIWDRAMEGTFVRSGYGLPVWANRDVLLLTAANRFILVDADGKEILDQVIGNLDRLEISDRDNNGVPEFYVIGERITCYELKLK